MMEDNLVLSDFSSLEVCNDLPPDMTTARDQDEAQMLRKFVWQLVCSGFSDLKQLCPIDKLSDTKYLKQLVGELQKQDDFLAEVLDNPGSFLP